MAFIDMIPLPFRIRAMTVLMAAGVLISPAGAADPKAPPSTRPSVAAPVVAAGPIVVGLTAPITSLDPVDQGCPQVVAAALYRPLLALKTSLYDVDLDASMADVTVADDGVHVEIVLKTGLTFSDGSPITAGDVKDSLTRLLDPAAAGRPQHPALDASRLPALVSIEKVGLLSVTMTLKTSDATIESLLASARSGIVKSGSIAPGKVPIGSGPFTVRGPRTGGGFDLAPNVHAGIVPARAIAFVQAPGGGSKLFWLASGQGQVVEAPPGVIEQSLADQPGYGVARLARPGALVLAFDTAAEPTNDQNIREALVHSIDRTSLVGHIFDGQARPARGFLDPYLTLATKSPPPPASPVPVSPAQSPIESPSQTAPDEGTPPSPGDAQSTPEQAGSPPPAGVLPGSPAEYDRIFTQKMLTYLRMDKGMAIDAWIVADGRGGITDPDGLAESMRISMGDCKIGLIARIVRADQLDAQLALVHPHILVMAVDEPIFDPVYRLRTLQKGAHPLAKVASWSPSEFPDLLEDGLTVTGSTREYICGQLADFVAQDVAVRTLAVSQTTWIYRVPVKGLHPGVFGLPDFTNVTQ